ADKIEFKTRPLQGCTSGPCLFADIVLDVDGDRNPFCRPPFQRRRPEILSAGRRFSDGDRKPFLPAAVSATGAGNPLRRPPFQRRRPESLSAGRRFSDGDRKPFMMPAVPPSGTECYSPDGCDRACLSPVFPTCHRPVAKF